VNFLIDNQLPPVPVNFFRERGCECHHVLDVGMASSSDIEIFEYATSHFQIIVSKDEDFFYLSRRLNSDIRLLWIRLGNCRTTDLISALERRWLKIARCFEAGENFVELR
jgi:predicted nuclease of predicted toxin-antitoxin system